MASFMRPHRVRFGECDPAGIVFYPRYFEMVTELQEDWFSDGLGIDHRDLHMVRGLITPTAHLECDFHRPSRLGDLLDCVWDVDRIGGASLHCRVALRHKDELRVEVRLVLVFCDRGTGRPVPIPDDIRAAILARHEVS